MSTIRFLRSASSGYQLAGNSRQLEVTNTFLKDYHTLLDTPNVVFELNDFVQQFRGPDEVVLLLCQFPMSSSSSCLDTAVSLMSPSVDTCIQGRDLIMSVTGDRSLHYHIVVPFVFYFKVFTFMEITGYQNENLRFLTSGMVKYLQGGEMVASASALVAYRYIYLC